MKSFLLFLCCTCFYVLQLKAEPDKVLSLAVQIDITTEISCNGLSDGELLATATGGALGYSYTWSNGQTNNPITGLSAGTYSVTVSDGAGDRATASVNLSDPPALSSTVTSQDESCVGSGDGSASVTAIGGTPPYVYIWSNGGNTAMITGLSVGIYQVTIADNNGCRTSNSATIGILSNVTVNTSIVSPISCNMGNDGVVAAIAGGGVLPYSYLWSNGEATSAISGLSMGTYTVTVTDANSCIGTGSITLSDPPMILSSIAAQPVSCFGGSDGIANVMINGGVPPYTYSWNSGQTLPTATGLLSGIATVTVTDSNNCTVVESIGISEPTLLSLAAVEVQPVSCAGTSDGVGAATSNGGTPPFSFAWSNSETTPTASSLSAGLNTVTITDANSCTATASVLINESAPLSFSVSSLQASCNGSADGSANVTNIAGGTPPYTIDWSNGQTGSTATGLSAGSYLVSVTDDNGCATVTSVSVTEPSVLMAVSSVVNQVSCNGENDGEADVSVTGGTTPYTYNWSTGGTSASVGNLGPGTYDVTITDGNNCVAVAASITITEPQILTGILSTQSVSCFGEDDGSAIASAGGGTTPYSYDWSNGMSGATLTGLSSGSLQVTITDANGCSIVKSGTVTSPPVITATATVVSMVSCNGLADGAAMVSGNGGSGSLSYLWDTGDTGTAINNLSAGTYTVSVTDANNCTETTSITITEPTALTSSNASNNVTCNGLDDGSCSVLINGGVTPYLYLWNNGSANSSINDLSPGNYTVTITDGNDCKLIENFIITEPSVLIAQALVDNQVSCNGAADGQAGAYVNGGTPPFSYQWSNGETSATISNLSPGTYNVTVIDANLCQQITSSVFIIEPSVVTGNVTTQPVACFGNNDGSATVSAGGGVSPYTYNWSDGQSGATANNLPAGVIQVTITDATGCEEVKAASVGTPTQITATTNEDNAVSCYGLNDGAASVSSVGGMPPYTYSWDNGATSSTINNLLAGTYNVTITDANNCNQIASVTVTQPILLTANLQGTNISCNGENDGSVSAVVNGGSIPYSYNWSNGFTSSSINNLQPGNYIVTITDVNGCKTIRNITVTEPAVLTSSIQLNNNVSCNGGNDGSSTASGIGGSNPYTYVWDNGETNSTANQLDAGIHEVTIIDVNGCKTVNTINLTEPGGINGAFPSVSSVSCNGGNDGMATVSVNGGQGPYTYLWDTGETSATANSLNAGIHRVTITDNSGCKKVFSINITQPLALSLAVTPVLPASCKGNDEGVATAAGGNGTGPYSYVWSNGATGPSASGFSAGTHQVTVTDNNGCKLVKQFDIASSFLPLGSVWKYLDNGSNQGAAWRSTSFNDASWNAGPAQLGYGDGDEATVVSYGNNSNNKHITTYFRKTVNITDSRYLASGGEISILHDDGAVVYLNGTEIYRSANLPGGNIAYSTVATYSWPENSYENIAVDASNFVLGNNVFAVEIHQRSRNSSDISFDMSLCESPEPEILRGPYLQLGTENSMIVRFRTNLTARAEIVYGTNPNNLNNTTPLSNATTEHQVQINGLSADTKYYYEIILNEALVLPNTSEHYFVTSPTVGTSGDYRLWFLGDCGTANNNQRAVRDGFINFNGGNAHPDLMLFLGDNAYPNGTDPEYQVAVFENMYENTLRNTVSLSCPGNHDYYSGADADTETGTYYDIFNFPRNGEAGGLASGTEAYYSYDYGNIHIISMDSHDSDRSPGGAMLTWLTNDLANTTQEWIIAIWHHPAYSKGSHNSDTEAYLIQMRENALPILEAAGVDLILSGHSHSYERSKFVKGHHGHSSTFNNTMVVQKGAGHASVDSAYCKYSDGHFDGDGMVYITAGASGKISGGSYNHPVMYYSKAELGSVVVDVDGTTMDVSYVGHDNQVKDQFTINKKANYDPTTDQDGDGHTDIEECPTGWPCVDSDNDGEPDIRDEDSDGDNTPDITDPCRVGQGLIASVLLEGAVDTNSTVMYTTLNTVRRILPGQTPVSGGPPTPAGHPYSIAPWNYNGSEGAGFNDNSYNTDVVDWVLVSLRTNTGATSEVWKAAALLNADGSIEFMDACLPPSMWNGSYYVVIEHRNHMGVMSVNRISVSDGVYEQDFRTGDSYTANGTGFGQIQLLSGVWAMYAGDLDQNDSPSYDVNGSDILIQNATNGIFNKYLPGDANMNGDVNGFDKILWNRNNGISSRVPR